MMNSGNVAFRRELERKVKLELVEKIAREEAIEDYDPHSENSKTGDKSENNRRKRRTGLSIGVSVAETCSPTEQCAGCYASEPETHSTYDNKIVRDLVNIRRIRRDPVRFAAQSLSWLERRGSLRAKIDGGIFYGLRWLSGGDLTPAIVKAIVAWLKLSSDWEDRYGKPLVACVFSRKPREIKMLIAGAEAAGVGRRLAINFSLDGTLKGREESIKRLRELGTDITRVRLVQYVKPGDYIWTIAKVYFPHHDKRTHDKSWMPADTRDRICPAIGSKSIGCLNCLTCYWPTVTAGEGPVGLNLTFKSSGRVRGGLA